MTNEEIAKDLFIDLVKTKDDLEEFMDHDEEDFYGKFEHFHYFDKYAYLAEIDQEDVMIHFYNKLYTGKC
jgi:hypothetical protein